MDFRSFAQVLHDLREQGAPRIRAAAQVILRLEDLPPSSDPRVLAKSLHKLLDQETTEGFQIMVMLYAEVVTDNELPAELKHDSAKLLDAINAIIHLQNADPDHRWPSPLHQERFGKRK